jgi:hypothetical protein
VKPSRAWWDASQIYGYDERSRRRMRRDPSDSAKLETIPVVGRASAGDRYPNSILPATRVFLTISATQFNPSGPDKKLSRFQITGQSG